MVSRDIKLVAPKTTKNTRVKETSKDWSCEIGVYNLRLLRSISMHARYTLYKYAFMKLLK